MLDFKKIIYKKKKCIAQKVNLFPLVAVIDYSDGRFRITNDKKIFKKDLLLHLLAVASYDDDDDDEPLR